MQIGGQWTPLQSLMESHKFTRIHIYFMQTQSELLGKKLLKHTLLNRHTLIDMDHFNKGKLIMLYNITHNKKLEPGNEGPLADQ